MLIDELLESTSRSTTTTSKSASGERPNSTSPWRKQDSAQNGGDLPCRRADVNSHCCGDRWSASSQPLNFIRLTGCRDPPGEGLIRLVRVRDLYVTLARTPCMESFLSVSMWPKLALSA